MGNETSHTHRAQHGHPLAAGDETPEQPEQPEREPDAPAKAATTNAQDDDLAWAGPPGSLRRYLTLQEDAGPISGL